MIIENNIAASANEIMLHDQRVTKAVRDGDKIIFTFDTKIYESDCSKELYERYKNFRHCEMTVFAAKDVVNYFNFESAVDENDKYIGYSASEEKFIEMINSSRSDFVSCCYDDTELIIELCGEYGEYCTCRTALYAEKLTLFWS